MARKTLLKRMAKTLRKQNQKRITKQQSADGRAWAARKGNLKKKRINKQGRVARNKNMMLGLRKIKRLKTKVSAGSLSVGWEGQDARVALIHHHGLREKHAQGSKTTHYPARSLIGINSADKQLLHDVLLHEISP